MPRSRRRRAEQHRRTDDSLEQLLAGWKRTEMRRGREWIVQPVSAPRALKNYSCPGCTSMIAPGTAHVVVWSADSALGESAALASRRHWHSHCWRLA